jgi:hypothetical protein
MFPTRLSTVRGLGDDWTFGFLSNTSKMFAASFLPLAKFYKQGPAYPRENPPVKIAKKITKTSPAEYVRPSLVLNV